jgi:hypothetical protein
MSIEARIASLLYLRTLLVSGFTAAMAGVKAGEDERQTKSRLLELAQVLLETIETDKR